MSLLLHYKNLLRWREKKSIVKCSREIGNNNIRKKVLGTGRAFLISIYHLIESFFFYFLLIQSQISLCAWWQSCSLSYAVWKNLLHAAVSCNGIGIHIPCPERESESYVYYLRWYCKLEMSMEVRSDVCWGNGKKLLLSVWSVNKMSHFSIIRFNLHPEWQLWRHDTSTVKNLEVRPSSSTRSEKSIVFTWKSGRHLFPVYKF